MSDSHHYKAFLSYSHVDREWAMWLHRSLERYRVPKHLRDRAKGDRIHPVFRDSEELPTSSDLSSAIRTALRQSESLVVLCSPNSAKSRWVNEEIRLFKTLGRPDNIHCVVVEGHKGDPLESLVPREVLSGEGGNAEPVAADARSHADGKDQAKIKLIAGLIGVGVDELRNRENQRRHRRWMMLASGLGTALLTMTTLVVIAVASREQALKAEQLAAREAEAAREVSDFLIDQFEVSDPGVIRGESVTAREILERSVARLYGLRAQPLVRARLMQTIGRAYTKLGLYDEALPLLSGSVEAREEQLGVSHPVVASSLTDLALLKMEMGAFAEADTLFTDAMTIVESQQDPDELELAKILNNLGVLYTHGIAGKHEESDAMFQRALEIRERLLPPAHPDLLESQALLASRYEHVGRFDEAIVLYEDALLKWESAHGPDHPEVAWTLNSLAWRYSQRGDAQEAERYFLRALLIRERVLGPEHPELAWTQYNLGTHYLNEKDYQKAEEQLAGALVILDARFGPRGRREGVPWYLDGLESTYAALLRATGREDEASRFDE